MTEQQLRKARTLRDDAGMERLTCRPYTVGSEERRETWRWLAKVVLGPAGVAGSDHSFRGLAWRGHRNKVKELESLVRGGKEAVTGALESWRVTAPGLRLPGELGATGGYLGNRTPLLDALELMDLHWPLAPLEETEDRPEEKLE